MVQSAATFTPWIILTIFSPLQVTALMFWTNRIAGESLEFLFEQKHQTPWLLTLLMSNCEMKIFAKLLQVLLHSKQNNKKKKNKPDTNSLQSKQKKRERRKK